MARIRLADIAKLREKLQPAPKPHLKFVMEKEQINGHEQGAIWVWLAI